MELNDFGPILRNFQLKKIIIITINQKGFTPTGQAATDNEWWMDGFTPSLIRVNLKKKKRNKLPEESGHFFRKNVMIESNNFDTSFGCFQPKKKHQPNV